MEDEMPRAQGQFRQGTSGNPAGRPRGSRSRAAIALEEIVDGQAEAITRKVIELALAGDGPALRLCMDRLLPPRRERPVAFTLPPLEARADVAKAMAAIIAATAAGELTPGEAADFARLVAEFGKVLEVGDLAERLARLEEAAA